MNPPVVDFEENELASYAYSYPHKSSYRPLDPPRPLDDVWQDESRDRLALYAHIPFCEMRCRHADLDVAREPVKAFGRRGNNARLFDPRRADLR